MSEQAEGVESRFAYTDALRAGGHPGGSSA
jgi:hypothetical protein